MSRRIYYFLCFKVNYLIYTPSTLRDNKGNKLRPQIEIEFAIEDLPIAKKIQETLNGGIFKLKRTVIVVD